MIKEVMKDAGDKMEKAISVAREEVGGLRTGRANPALFSKVMVDYYGAPTPMQNLATFQVPEARTVLITPFDKSSMSAIERAISEADLGVNPSNDGNTIRCILPALTEERRRDYIKMARGMGEDAKVAIRAVRRKAKDEIDALVKDGDVGEDEGARAEKDLQALTDKHTKVVDEMVNAKEKELMEV